MATKPIKIKQKDMILADIDYQEQYSPSKWSTRMSADEIVPAHVEQLKSATLNARSALKCEKSVRYSDNGKNTLLDIYYPADYTKGTQVFMYIHGGYWQALGLDQTGSFAKSVTDMGLIYVGVGYDLCPDVELSEIVKQIQEAFCFVRHRFPFTHGFHIMGHSAGAHLATMIMAQPAHDFPELLPITLYPVSGIFDLRPLLNTDINDPLNLTIETAQQLSPMDPSNFKTIYSNTRRTARFIIIHAENDSPAFHEQSRHFYELLKQTGCNTVLIEIENTDHFDIVEKAIDPSFKLNKVINEELTPPSSYQG